MVDIDVRTVPGRRFVSNAARGFTLLEIMVVVVILGILAALVAPQVIGRIDDAAIAKAKQDIQTYGTALNLFRMDNFKYPSTDQGLKSLVEKPTDSSIRAWKQGGYIDTFRKDPWGFEYHYVYPGQHGKEYDLFSLGADNQEGGEGINADFANWDPN